MALQGFISGPGPFYQLEAAAPGSDGRVLVSEADGVARWNIPPARPNVYVRGGVRGVTPVPGPGLTRNAILISYKVEPAEVPQGSTPIPTDGSEVFARTHPRGRDCQRRRASALAAAAPVPARVRWRRGGPPGWQVDCENRRGHGVVRL